MLGFQTWVPFAAFVVSAGLTGVLRAFALRWGVLDLPNARGSHSVPTPRGGGVAIVVASLGSALVLWWATGSAYALALLSCGLPVALVGLVDDLRGLSARTRLSVHALACAGAAALLGSLPALSVGAALLPGGFLASCVGVTAVVWFLNLFNFMDGIDGIAATEAITVTVSAAVLLWLTGGPSADLPVLLAVAAAAAGFLVWNWPPAKIFMGDAGSGFTGFALAIGAWATIVAGRSSVWVWLILTAAFSVDATVTLWRRWRRGANPAVAHRSHAYQRLSRRYGSHRRVTLGVAAVNLGWLLPLAYWAQVRPGQGWLAALIAWAPLVATVRAAGAGMDDDGQPGGHARQQ